jgi:hypothetical protein
VTFITDAIKGNSYNGVGFIYTTLSKENTMLDTIVLLITGAVAAYLLWRFWGRYNKDKALYDIY